MLVDIDTKKNPASTSYKDMDQLDFQILLPDNYYVNPSTIHTCFPMKIKKATNVAGHIDNGLMIMVRVKHKLLKKRKNATDLIIQERITKFHDMISDEHVHRVPLK